MFLFSGTFFPVSRLPLPLEWLAYVTPLWHGVDLARMLTLGHVHLLRAAGHVAYLLVFVVVGLIWMRAELRAEALCNDDATRFPAAGAACSSSGT